jgi:hypothetical protein
VSPNLDDNLPEVLRTLRTRPLFVMRLNVRKLQIVGATPAGYRRMGVVPGGSFDGERLSGEVLDGANDWQTVRPDGATTLNVRLVLKTNDEALIGMTYRAIVMGRPMSWRELREEKWWIRRAIISDSTHCSRRRT